MKNSEECDERAEALRMWRSVPADAFDAVSRATVANCVSHVSSTIVVWRQAVEGDAPSAIRIVLRMNRPTEITRRLDLTMTILLNCALNGNAAAALVLSHRLRQVPIEGASGAAWPPPGWRTTSIPGR